ncbi:MAG: hypothetical protein ABJB55_02160 [Actinomycetota bacterium]
MPHQAVVSNLLDLQARLRGDPASMIVPRVRPPVPSAPVLVSHDDVAVTETPDVSQPDEPVDRLLVETDDAEERIDALRRRLQYLELEIDAYASAAPAIPVQDERAIGEGNVTDLQHAVERRATQD